MSNVIDSLLVRIGFDVDTHGVEGAKHHVGLLKESLEALGVMAGVELAHRFVEFVEHAIGGAAAVQEFSETTGIAAEKVDAMSRAAADAGVPMEAMKDAIMGVFTATGAAAAGFPRYTRLFQQLGLHAKDSTGHVKDAQSMMGELADKFGKMDAATRIAVAGRLGINARLAAMMAEEGSAGMNARFGEASRNGLLTAEDFERAHATELSIEKLHRTIQAVTTIVANQLSPWLTKALDTFQEWWKVNRTEVLERFRAGVTALGHAIGTVTSFFRSAYGVVRDVIDVFDELGISGGIVKTVVAAIVAYKLGGWATQGAAGLANLISQFGHLKIATAFTGALIAAIALLLQDLWVWHKGGKSFLKQLSEEYPAAMYAIITAVTALTAAWVAMKVQAVTSMMGAAGAAHAAASATHAVGTAARSSMGAWIGLVGVIASLAELAVPPILDALGIVDIGKVRMGKKTKKFVKEKANQEGGFTPYAPSDEVDALGNPLWLGGGKAPASYQKEFDKFAKAHPSMAGAGVGGPLSPVGMNFTGTVVNVYNRNAEEAAKSQESIVKGTRAAAIRKIRHVRAEGQ